MKKIHFLEKENLRLTELIKHHQEESLFLNDALIDFLEINKDLNRAKNVTLSLKEELRILNDDFDNLKEDYAILSKKNRQLIEDLNDLKKDNINLTKKNSQLTEDLNGLRKNHIFLSEKNFQLLNINRMNQIKIKNLETYLIKNKFDNSNSLLQKIFFLGR